MVADLNKYIFYARKGSENRYVVDTDAQFSSSELCHQRLHHMVVIKRSSN